MKITVMMAATLMVLTGCVTTDPAQLADNTAASNPPAVASAAKGAEGADGIRCEYRPILGSRVGKKLCYSEVEWALMEKQADDLMKYIDEQTKSSPLTSKGG